MLSTGISEYEQRRLRNLEENRRILGELGAFNLMPPPQQPRAPRPKASVAAKKPKKFDNQRRSKPAATDGGADGCDDDEALARTLAESEGRRRSSRLEGRPAPKYVNQCDGYGKDDSNEENWSPDNGGGSGSEDDDDSAGTGDEDADQRRHRRQCATVSGISVFDRPKVEKNRPNFYGAVPGLAVGTLFETRIDACLAGIHRPTVAGIHGGAAEGGAFSIALSGGYEDDIDLGSHFTYTGEGGRDLKGTKNNPKNLRTAPQTRDQHLSRNNAALVRSAENGQPVRVLRGYKLKSEYAPPEGYYRYDGLYRVEKWWYTTGTAGFGVYKFAFKRVAEQEAAPWDAPADQEPKVYDFRVDYKPDAGSSKADAGARDEADEQPDEAKNTRRRPKRPRSSLSREQNSTATEDDDNADGGGGGGGEASESSPAAELPAPAAVVGEKKKRGRRRKDQDADTDATAPSAKAAIVEVNFNELIATEAEAADTDTGDAGRTAGDEAPDEKKKEKLDQSERPQAAEELQPAVANPDIAPGSSANIQAVAVNDDNIKKKRGRPSRSAKPAVDNKVAPAKPLGCFVASAGEDRAVSSPPRKRSRFYFEDAASA